MLGSTSRPNPIILDRWADAFRHTRPNTNDFRANRGDQDRRIAHQVRHAERKLTYSERCTRAIAAWKSQQNRSVN